MDSKWKLHEYTSELLDVPDEAWVRFAFGRLPAGSSGELTRMVDASRQMASEHWTWLLDRQSGNEPLTPVAEVSRHGVRVVEQAPGPLDSHYVHFAAFDPTARAIHVSIASVKSVAEHVEQADLVQVLGPVSVLDVVLWHEYFHVWSHVMRKANENNRRGWRFKSRSRETRLHRTIEELAAVEFSKRPCGLAFNPQLLQWILIYTKDPRRARELARDVLGKSW